MFVLFMIYLSLTWHMSVCDHTMIVHVMVWDRLNNSSELFLSQKYLSIETQPSSCIIKAIISERLSPLLSAALDWIEGSLWGRWTISRPYYWCNYTHLRPPHHQCSQSAAWKGTEKLSLGLTGIYSQSCVHIPRSFMTTTAQLLSPRSAA